MTTELKRLELEMAKDALDRARRAMKEATAKADRALRASRRAAEALTSVAARLEDAQAKVRALEGVGGEAFADSVLNLLG